MERWHSAPLHNILSPSYEYTFWSQWICTPGVETVSATGVVTLPLGDHHCHSLTSEGGMGLPYQMWSVLCQFGVKCGLKGSEMNPFTAPHKLL